MGSFSFFFKRSSKNSVSSNEMEKIAPISHSKCTIGGLSCPHYTIGPHNPSLGGCATDHLPLGGDMAGWLLPNRRPPRAVDPLPCIFLHSTDIIFFNLFVGWAIFVTSSRNSVILADNSLSVGIYFMGIFLGAWYFCNNIHACMGFFFGPSLPLTGDRNVHALLAAEDCAGTCLFSF